EEATVGVADIQSTMHDDQQPVRNVVASADGITARVILQDCPTVSDNIVAPEPPRTAGRADDEGELRVSAAIFAQEQPNAVVVTSAGLPRCYFYCVVLEHRCCPCKHGVGLAGARESVAAARIFVAAWSILARVLERPEVVILGQAILK